MADGYQALYSNNADYNVGVGYEALYSNTTGYANAAFGYAALLLNTTGYVNMALGAYALQSNTTGYFNSAIGADALYTNTTGFNNIADGVYALFYNTTGSYNSVLGVGALVNNTTGSGNIGMGYYAGNAITTGNNNIDIGNYVGQTGDNGVIRIGTVGTNTATYIAGISGVTASGGVAVYVNSNGQLGTLTSSRRFKSNIKGMGNVTDKLMDLRPVTFQYKDSAEQGEHHRQYGLIAEEVAKVYPDLVQYDKQGKPFTVYYHLLTPMLLNEAQKAHKQVESDHAEIAELKAKLVHQDTELAAMKKAQAEMREMIAAQRR